MRIQHNVLAMNAYRNYNTNTSALAKNLEKLSSGYKINRAGDDAAGLAISEKMRAQITGLNAAQKNVKDGISLVKTAEGAMQEIQDMLNRMDYLATQSANGTYDNEVDRLNLNKEMDALKEEINRIADSANFNGIKLLDGSLDSNAVKGGSAAVTAQTSAITIPDVGDELGVDTILHEEKVGNDAKTTFKVDLADFQFAAKAGDSMTVKVGDNTFTISATADEANPLDGESIAKAIAGTLGNNNITVTLDPGTGTAAAFDGSSDKAVFNDQNFTVTAEGNKLKFEQDAKPTSTAENVDGKMDVTISGAGASASKGKYVTGALTAGSLGTPASKSTDASDTKADSVVADSKIEISAKLADGTTAVKFEKTDIAIGTDADALATALGNLEAKKADGSAYEDGEGNKVKLSDLFTISADADKITFEAKTAGEGKEEVTGVTFTAGTVTTDNSSADGTYDTAGTAPTVAALAAGTGWTAGAGAGANGSGGDWNVQTIEVTNGVYKDRDRLASTVVELKADMFQDGGKIKIADKEIDISAAAADKASTSKLYIGDMVGEGKTMDLAEVSRRLSVLAAGNNAWTVSAWAEGDRAGISLMEKTKADGTSDAASTWDLTTKAGIEATLSFTTPGKDAVTGEAGKALTLQIGDTSDTFNQLSVGIGDMHVNAMGKGKATVDGKEVDITDTIDTINIKDQESAQKAINVIKNAINYVSGVRGDLGAVQNRLEHTANNLSVMAENIQDAESTIRDTDIAEEMMSYTKNNILVQSAQAMLAQANAVPQGVLQLLG